MRKFSVLFSLMALVLLAVSPALAQDDMMDSGAHIRVAHFSPDTPAVDVYINGELSAVQGLEFPSVTDWIEVPADTYTIAVSPAGTSVDDAAIGPADLTFEAGSWTTIAAVGSLESGTLAPAIIAEDYSEIPEGSVRVGVFHAIEGAPSVDVLAGGSPIVTYLAFPGTQDGNDGFFDLTVPADTYDLQVVASDTSDVLIDLQGTELTAGTNYLVAAVAVDGTPTAIVQATSMGMDMMEDPGTIVDIAASNEDFSTLVAALSAADLVDTLNTPGPFTVFAPTNEAFAAALEALDMSAEELLSNTDLLTTILTYHVVDGMVLAEDVVTLDSATTIQGEDISIAVVDGGVVLNDSVNVVTTDIVGSNGVIHVIDGVLVPPSVMEMMMSSMEEMEAPTMTIAEIAAADGRFTTLLAAVTAAGLDTTLADPEAGPLTVFAPTDDAFAALPAGTVEALLADPTGALTDVLTYHVVAGAVPAADVVNLDSATTLQGSDISIAVVDGGVVLNDSVNVIITDIMATNGIIHVIDAVLLPPAAE